MTRKITYERVELRRATAVQAARGVFLRYGYARTTMAELAVAAQLSRPSLYEIFPGKESLFSAVVRQLNEETLQEFRQALPGLRTLRTKLHRFCGDWGTHGVRLTQRHPDAEDLFDLKSPVVREMYEEFVRFLVEVISAEPHATLLPLEKVVRNLVFSLRGLEEAATGVAQMEELIQIQVDVFLLTLSPKE